MHLADRDRWLVLGLEHAEGGEDLGKHDVAFLDRARLLGTVGPGGRPPADELRAGAHQDDRGETAVVGAGAHGGGIDLVLANARPGRLQHRLAHVLAYCRPTA